jgi:D-sedoheptulose 7-phosphate isomerase
MFIKTKCNFENLEEKISNIINQKVWGNFISDFKKADNIYMIGNGGNWAVATHGAADISRLTTKKVFSLDSPCYITSLTNDHGYEKLFSKWIEKYYDGTQKNLLIAFSGSGNSPNIIDALNWSKKKKNFKQILISGLKSSKLKKNIMQISFNTKYFHTAEILSIMLFYEMVYQLGFSCPTISSEIQRKFK